MSDFSGILDDLYDDGEDDRSEGQPAATPPSPAEAAQPPQPVDEIADVLATWGPAVEADVPPAPAPPPPPQPTAPPVTAPEASSRDLDDDLAAALSAALADDPVTGSSPVATPPPPPPPAPAPPAPVTAPPPPPPPAESWTSDVAPPAAPSAPEPSPWAPAAPVAQPSQAPAEWVTVEPPANAPIAPAAAAPTAAWSRGADDILPGVSAGKSRSGPSRGRKSKEAPPSAAPSADSGDAFFGPDTAAAPDARSAAPVGAAEAPALEPPPPLSEVAAPAQKNRFGARSRSGPRNFNTRKR